MLLAGDDYAGAAAMPATPLALPRVKPVNPGAGQAVSFDASFARAADGSTDGLTYYWDFGDGTHATGKTVSHTFAGAIHADVKLALAAFSAAGVW
jgi:hypothetical protein